MKLASNIMKEIMHNIYKKLLILLLLVTIILHAGSTRIMPLGDSITQGINGSLADEYQSGYRSSLWNLLNNADYNINLVGSQTEGYALSPSFDYNHEGYAWWTTQNIASHIYGFLANNPTDIILLHIGSNDVSPNQDNSSSVTGLNNILNQIDYYERDYNHPIRVVLTTIIQRTTYHQTLRDYNRNLINLANSRIANGDKITLIDMEYGTGMVNSDYSDSVHPDNSGYYKMANVWFDSLKNILPPPPPPAPTDVVISSVTASSATLSWNDTSTSETGFKIYQGSILIATVGANVTSYPLTNLTGNTTYTFLVRSYNSEGESSTSAIITFTTEDDYAWLIAVNHIILN